MKKLLQDKTIVVTGCASGIGRETARLCKAWGATVLGVDRTVTHEHVDELYKADLSDPVMIRQLENYCTSAERRGEMPRVATGWMDAIYLAKHPRGQARTQKGLVARECAAVERAEASDAE